MPCPDLMTRLSDSFRNQRGSVTLEAALGLSSLVIVCAGMIGGIATLAAQVAAIDSAGAAARSHAIGVEYQPTRGSLQIQNNGDLVTVTAEIPAVFGPVRATAVYPQEVP